MKSNSLSLSFSLSVPWWKGGVYWQRLVSRSRVKARFSTCWNSSQLLPFAKAFLVNETRALYSRNFAHKGYRSARFIRTTCTLVIISKCLPPWTFRGKRHRWDVVCRGFNESSTPPPGRFSPTIVQLPSCFRAEDIHETAAGDNAHRRRD